MQDVSLAVVNSTAGYTENAQNPVKVIQGYISTYETTISMVHVRYVFTNARTFIPQIIPKRQ